MSETLTYETLLAMMREVEAPGQTEAAIEAKLRDQIERTRATPSHLIVPDREADVWMGRRIARRLGLECQVTRWLTTPGEWYLVDAKSFAGWSR